MGRIVGNEPCPECTSSGHDKTGNHLIRFDDGGGYCHRKQFHKSGETYYEQKGEARALSDLPITGTVKYSVGDFKELEDAGKLKDPLIRAVALGGMQKKERWAVLNEEEREAQVLEWQREMEWFSQLKRGHLVDRGIHGAVAAFYNTRLGHDEQGRVNRHYYPNYEEGELCGAKCRTLPKGFQFGHLGKRFGELDLFGMHTMKAVADSGQKKNMLLIVGGEPDCMASQQMLVKELNGLDGIGSRTNLEGLKLFHVWSVNKGESGIEELIHNRKHIEQFRTIIWAFDNDEAGEKLNRAAAKLFRGKSKRLIYPKGTKDANDCLKQGRDSEFVTAVFQAEEQKVTAKVKSVEELKGKARQMVEMGKKYWLDGFNKITFGIRLHYLAVWGAGTGVGKTDTTLAHVHNLMQQGEDCVVIYLENQTDEVARTFAGMLVGKDFNSPPQEQWEIDAGIEVNPARQYNQEDLDNALDMLAKQDRLRIADLDGSKDVDAVMEVMEECLAMGYQYFVIDNLTAFEHKNEKGDVATGVRAIDETMKRLGTFKDENPVNIFLLSHLVKVHEGAGRNTHSHGGEVYESDFRGAGSITFWANAVWGIERNTMAKTFRHKCITLYRNLKNRGIGHMVGSTVLAEKDIRTGKYTELKGVYELPEVGKDKPKNEEERQRNNFDDGGSRKNRGAPEPESEPTELPAEKLADGQEF